jgi:putative DNA primase/helicase
MTAPKTSPIRPARQNQHHLPWDRFSHLKKLRPLAIAKPTIPYDTDLHEVAKLTWQYLEEFNNPPFLFRGNGKLCRIESDKKGFPTVSPVDVPRMNFVLVELFYWLNSKGDNSRPPGDLAPHLVADPDPPCPTLNRIVTAPIVTSTGRLLDKPCAFADGIIHLPPKAFRLADLPPDPTATDIQSAIEFIDHNLLADFCFVDQIERANCFSALLTPFVREMIDGPTPMFWVDKSKGGSGGTLLSNIISAPFLGTAPSGITAPRDEAEWNRVILSTLLRSPNVFFIDNCNDDLSSEALASAITSSRFEGRIIGSSRNESAEVRCLWIINGNNLRLGWELARRVVRIRIDPGVGRPDRRESEKFVHPNLLAWVVEHRADVVYHLLVLVMAWQSKDCSAPSHDIPEFGSFERWREVLGGILTVAGIPGFLANLEDARREADQESQAIRGFIEGWRAAFGTKPVFAADLVTGGRHFFELHIDPLRAAIQLGKILGKYESQIHDGYRIQRGPLSKGKTQWQLQVVPVP